mmetsp:Transcript_162913/g.522373  ORF Transcript_162913/g.522373 Transcript_162913/m.522373 type:complete len:334 (+) Transcript_162913:1369-2370(+)
MTKVHCLNSPCSNGSVPEGHPSILTCTCGNDVRTRISNRWSGPYTPSFEDRCGSVARSLRPRSSSRRSQRTWSKTCHNTRSTISRPSRLGTTAKRTRFVSIGCSTMLWLGNSTPMFSSGATAAATVDVAVDPASETVSPSRSSNVPTSVLTSEGSRASTSSLPVGSAPAAAAAAPALASLSGTSTPPSRALVSSSFTRIGFVSSSSTWTSAPTARTRCNVSKTWELRLLRHCSSNLSSALRVLSNCSPSLSQGSGCATSWSRCRSASGADDVPGSVCCPGGSGSGGAGEATASPRAASHGRRTRMSLPMQGNRRSTGCLDSAAGLFSIQFLTT